MNKEAKIIYKKLELMLGDYNAGLIIAILCDLLQECCGENEYFNIRSLELKINDFFVARHEFEEKNNEIH